MSDSDTIKYLRLLEAQHYEDCKTIQRLSAALRECWRLANSKHLGNPQMVLVEACQAIVETIEDALIEG